MARPKRTFNFTVGVFGIPARIDQGGVVRIKCNVRTDQARQKEIAGLEPSSTVLLVDCPGGAVGNEDKSIDDDALAREISEETGGCTITPKGDFRPPFALLAKVVNETGEAGDLAFWKPVVLHGEPKPSNEALDHPWLSRAELEAADRYRAISGLGLLGRTGRMMTAALDFYEANKDKPELFS